MAIDKLLLRVKTADGYNAVSSDVGSVTIEYRADPALTYGNLESTITADILSLGAGV